MTYQETPKTPLTRSRINVTTVISVAVGVGVLVLLAFALFSPGGGRPLQGEPAPDFTLASFDGSEISLSDLQGQVVVLNFWASWCSPCRQEAADLQSVWEMYEGQGAVFLGVSHKDAEDAARAFVEEFGLTYSNGADPGGKISRAYGITGVPETFVIDGEGKVARSYIGPVVADELALRLAQMIGQ
jgi:cytochrome c biogenesis protein CcmG/thiol:disulfide interchange protein DsbE